MESTVTTGKEKRKSEIQLTKDDAEDVEVRFILSIAYGLFWYTTDVFFITGWNGGRVSKGR